MHSLLALETSSPVLSVAVKKGAGPILESSFDRGGVTPPVHSEHLIPSIDRLLKKIRLSLQDIDAFLMGRGPGSFTGLRIGFAALKGLLEVSHKRKDCYGALSLDMIAENAAGHLRDGTSLGAILDARREKIYARFYRIRKGHAAAAGNPEVVSLEQIVSRLPSEIYLTGDALARYQAGFEKAAGKKEIHFLPESLWYPKASTLIEWYEGMKPNLRGKLTSPLQRLKKPADFLPLYFRLSEAEEKRNNHARAG